MVKQLEREIAPPQTNGSGSRAARPLIQDAQRALAQRPWAVPLLGVSVAVGLGLFVRLSHLTPYDYPLNDGGMFYSMVRDIQRSHYVLPTHTTYNSLHIPFAYPPLPFYLAAALDDATPLSLMHVFRFLPLIANVLTIVVVYLLARSFVRSRAPIAELAAIIFAVLPRSYRWLIMGGGLTRSLAFLFALTTIYLTLQLYRRGEKKYLFGAMAFGSLTILSHPEVTWYTGFCLGLLFLCYGRNRQAVVHSAVLLGGAFLITAPWWASVLIREGPGPFLSAAQTGGHSFDIWRAFLTWDFDEMIGLNWPPMLGIMGAIICIATGELFLPVWLVISIVLEPRSGATYITVPIAILSALAIVRFAAPFVRAQFQPAAGGAVIAEAERIAARPTLPALWEAAPAVVSRALPLIAVGLFAFYLSFLSVREALLDDPVLTSLSPQDRAAFSWVSKNTPQNSRFVLVTGNFSPFADLVSEWFPALTGRQSIATLQGYEWLGESAYYDQWDRFVYTQACPDAGCVESWMYGSHGDATYIYVAHHCCDALLRSLRSSYDFSVKFDSPAATVFARRY